jgi:hypothetical protein
MARGRPPKIGKKADERPERVLAIPAVVGPAAPAIPPMPPTLPAEAADSWAIVCMSLPGLTAADLGDVEICVKALHRYQQLDALIENAGYLQDVTIVNPITGDEHTSSIVPTSIVRLDMMRDRAVRQYRYHADQLGLSRMSRARLNLLDLAGKNEFVALAERVQALRQVEAKPKATPRAKAKPKPTPKPAAKPRSTKRGAK